MNHNFITYIYIGWQYGLAGRDGPNLLLARQNASWVGLAHLDLSQSLDLTHKKRCVKPFSYINIDSFAFHWCTTMHASSSNLTQLGVSVVVIGRSLLVFVYVS